MNRQLVIFDFDGTIANTLESTIKVVNSLGPEFGFVALDRADVEAFRTQGTKELFIKLKISKLKTPFFVMKIRTTLNKSILDSKPYPGIRELLSSLKQQGFRLGLLSSNSKANIKLFLSQYDLNYFDFLQGDSSVFGKAPILEKIIKQKGLNKSDVYYIGDEDRDVEAAETAGLKSVAVTWGFNNEDLLKRANPDYIVSTPNEILSIFNSK